MQYIYIYRYHIYSIYIYVDTIYTYIYMYIYIYIYTYIHGDSFGGAGARNLVSARSLCRRQRRCIYMEYTSIYIYSILVYICSILVHSAEDSAGARTCAAKKIVGKKQKNSFRCAHVRKQHIQLSVLGQSAEDSAGACTLLLCASSTRVYSIHLHTVYIYIYR